MRRACLVVVASIVVLAGCGETVPEPPPSARPTGRAEEVVTARRLGDLPLDRVPAPTVGELEARFGREAVGLDPRSAPGSAPFARLRVRFDKTAGDVAWVDYHLSHSPASAPSRIA